MELFETKIKELIVRQSKLNFQQVVETLATDMSTSEHVSPLDACGCTGNSFCAMKYGTGSKNS